MLIKCKMCGGDLEIDNHSSVCECEYCGSKQTIPYIGDEKKTNLFNRANRLRMSNEFDKAAVLFEQIIAEYPREAEAYWGLCLCDYGIEYVNDPASGKKVPTCHRTLSSSIMEDTNFEQACDFTDDVARRVYRDEAMVIDRIQKDILSVIHTEQPYDVFISYKETDADGNRTEDSVLAQDIYERLTEKGYRVFFSRITLEDKLGAQYEPYIYAALITAKVMLVFGTKQEYFEAPWVRNEWGRYLHMMAGDRSKTLVPCFKDMASSTLPKEFRHIQSQDMGKIGWMQDLVRGVGKIIGDMPELPNHAIKPAASTQQHHSVESQSPDDFIKLGYSCLAEERWASARKYFEHTLTVDERKSAAYIGLLLSDYCMKDESVLSDSQQHFEETANWKKAIEYANSSERRRLDSILSIAQSKRPRTLEPDAATTSVPSPKQSKKPLKTRKILKPKLSERKGPGLFAMLFRIFGALLCGFYSSATVTVYSKPELLFGILLVMVIMFIAGKNKRCGRFIAACLLSFVAFIVVAAMMQQSKTNEAFFIGGLAGIIVYLLIVARPVSAD